MPYIPPKDRGRVEAIGPCVAGELNYAITKLLTEYLGVVPPRYSDYNEVVGVLECCKLEMYRRMVAPYEDLKRAENGDVYPKELVE